MNPLTSATRIVVKLDGLWRWMPENALQPHNPKQLIQPVGMIPVPGALANCPELQEWVGVIWYETAFQVSHHMLAQRLVLNFEAVTYGAQVYVNGRQVTVHEGGYSAFEAAVNDMVVPGDNCLSVRVSTVLDAQSCPAAEMRVVSSESKAPQMVVKGLSFLPGGRGGITGSVYLYTTPWYYLSHCFPFLHPQEQKCLDLDFIGDYDHCYGFLQTQDGQAIETAETTKRRLSFSHEALDFWSPGKPVLYQIDLQFLKEQGLIDHLSTTIGWTQPDLLKKEYALSSIQAVDFEDGKRGNLNEIFSLLSVLAKEEPTPFIRLTAQPVLDAVLTYCDHLGIGVFVELPEITKIERNSGNHHAREQLLKEQIQGTAMHPCLLQWLQPLHGDWSENERMALYERLQKVFADNDPKERHIQLFQE